MNAIVKTAPAQIQSIMRPQSIGELDVFCQRAARSGMVPTAYANKPDAIFIAVQMGSELGLSPMQALSNIAVVNGRAAVWGDAMPGLCRQSAVCDDIEEWFTGDGEALTAHCKATRVGKQPVLQQFGVADAKKAGLWGKSGPWTQYPRRMLQMRARGFALRDAFPDVLRGLISYEEARDIPPPKKDGFDGYTLEAEPEAEAAPPPAPAPKRTALDYLNEVRAMLDTATNTEEVSAIAIGAKVRQGLDNLKGGPLEELNALLADAMQRCTEPESGGAEPQDVAEDDGWPGPKPGWPGPKPA